tara:strand:+ start:166 stop:369 length:204 start_codon:yes stop_codon:yes gene_type:complete
MREKINHNKTTMNEYGYKPYQIKEKRLDLNDLLNRVKVEKKTQVKNNIIVFSGIILAVILSYLVFTL